MFAIPCLETEPIEDVLFIEPQIEHINDAIDLVKRYNEEGKPWMKNVTKTRRQQPMISDHREQTNQWTDTQHVSNPNVQITSSVVRLSTASNAVNSPIIPIGNFVSENIIF